MAQRNRYRRDNQNTNSDSRLTGNIQDTAILANFVCSRQSRDSPLGEIQKKLRELKDISNYIETQLEEVIQMSKLLKRIVVDETDPTGYALIYLQPDHVICSCGTEMQKVPYDKGQRWVCPKCGAEIIVESPERGSRA